MPDDTEPPQPFALTWLLSGSFRLLTNTMRDRMAEAGFDDVRPSHGFAFQLLARGGASGAELAQHLGVTKQAASQLIDDLERRDWARRTPGPDKRTKTVVLTPAGWAVTRAAEQAGAQIEQELMASMGAARLRRLTDDLRRLGIQLGN